MFAAMAALAHSGLAMPNGVLAGQAMRKPLSRTSKARKERKQRGKQKPKTRFYGSEKAQARRIVDAANKRMRKAVRAGHPSPFMTYDIGVDMANGPDHGVYRENGPSICGASWGKGRCKFGEYHLCTRNADHKGKCLCERFDGSSTPCGARK